MTDHYPLVMQWLDHNQDFIIQGRSFRKWSEGYKWSHKPFMKVLNDKIEDSALFGNSRYDLVKASPYQVVWDIESNLGMTRKLLVSSRGYVGWGPAKAREDDLIVCCLAVPCQ
jgi:hypothetical protein